MYLPWVCHSWYWFVNLGKHKEHDVKTIRKAHPIVKGELEANLEKIEGNIENLQTRKS